MPLSLKLSEGNAQVVKGIVLDTGVTFYIKVNRPTRHASQLVIHSDRNEIYFGRVSEADLLYDGEGNIASDLKESRRVGLKE